MNKILKSFIFICTAGLMFLYAGAGRDCKCEKSHCGNWGKDVKVGIANIESGGACKITANQPEEVKIIQEHWADCQANQKTGNASCGHEHNNCMQVTGKYHSENCQCNGNCNNTDQKGKYTEHKSTDCHGN